MGPVPLTLLRLPAEIRNRVWRFSLPHGPDLEVDACIPPEAPSSACKFIHLKRYNWREEPLLVVSHQTRDEVDPWILKRKRVLKFCTDKCLERFLRETGDDRTARGGKAKPLDDLKIHLIVNLGPPPHSRMKQVVAKMRVAGEIQKLIARLRPELLSVDLLPIEIIQELCTAEEMHVRTHFVVKARRDATKSWHPNIPPGARRPVLTHMIRNPRNREVEEVVSRRRALRSTRSLTAPGRAESEYYNDEDFVDEYSTQHRTALERSRRRRPSTRLLDLNSETHMAIRTRSSRNPTSVNRRTGRSRWLHRDNDIPLE